MNISYFNTNYIIGILSIIFLSLFALSFIKRAKKNHRYNRKKSLKILNKINSFEHHGQRINYLRKIDPFIFEELLLDAFHMNGYTVQRNERYTGDNGIDGIVYKNDKKYLIQAKRYASHINLKHVQDFQRLVEKMNCQGYFIHTGRTGKSSREQEKIDNSITIISGTKLITLLNALAKDGN